MQNPAQILNEAIDGRCHSMCLTLQIVYQSSVYLSDLRYQQLPVKRTRGADSGTASRGGCIWNNIFQSLDLEMVGKTEITTFWCTRQHNVTKYSILFFKRLLLHLSSENFDNILFQQFFREIEIE